MTLAGGDHNPLSRRPASRALRLSAHPPPAARVVRAPRLPRRRLDRREPCRLAVPGPEAGDGGDGRAVVAVQRGAHGAGGVAVAVLWRRRFAQPGGFIVFCRRPANCASSPLRCSTRVSGCIRKCWRSLWRGTFRGARGGAGRGWCADQEMLGCPACQRLAVACTCGARRDLLRVRVRSVCCGPLYPQEPVKNGLAYGAESTQGLFYYYFVQRPRAVRAPPALPRLSHPSAAVALPSLRVVTSPSPSRLLTQEGKPQALLLPRDVWNLQDTERIDRLDMAERKRRRQRVRLVHFTCAQHTMCKRAFARSPTKRHLCTLCVMRCV